MEKINKYLMAEFDVTVDQALEEADDGPWYDRKLSELIEEYGKEQRKEGYMKGFEDGEESGEGYANYKANLSNG